MKFYFVNKSGEVAWDCAYAWSGAFKDGLACVRELSGDMAFISHGGEKKIDLPPFQTEPTQFFEGRALIRNGRKYGFVDLAGKVCIETSFYNATEFSEGAAAVLTADGYGFIGYDGQFVSDRFYSRLKRFSEGFAVAQIQSEYYFLNKALRPVLGPYEHAESFREGLAYVRIGEQGCFIDYQGEILFRNRWDWISPYCFCGRIDFCSGENQCGFIDRAGNIVIEPRYTAVDSFSEELAIVEDDRGKIVIDMQGKELFRIEAETCEQFHEGYMAFQGLGLWGYIDSSGVVRVTPRYEVAGIFSGGVAPVAIES